LAEIPGLDLTTLAHAVPALTMHLGTVLAEAAAVCLESNEHPQGVPLSVRGESSERFGLTWRPMTDTMRRAYNNEDGTEIGACGVAILLVREISGMAVIERSARGRVLTTGSVTRRRCRFSGKAGWRCRASCGG